MIITPQTIKFNAVHIVSIMPSLLPEFMLAYAHARARGCMCARVHMRVRLRACVHVCVRIGACPRACGTCVPPLASGLDDSLGSHEAFPECPPKRRILDSTGV